MEMSSYQGGNVARSLGTAWWEKSLGVLRKAKAHEPRSYDSWTYKRAERAGVSCRDFLTLSILRVAAVSTNGDEI
jgi:hypothetical protein